MRYAIATFKGLPQSASLPQEVALIDKMQRQLKSLSGRWLWWVELRIHAPENFSGAYNCTSTNVVDWRAFGLMMDLAMMAVAREPSSNQDTSVNCHPSAISHRNCKVRLALLLPRSVVNRRKSR